MMIGKVVVPGGEIATLEGGTAKYCLQGGFLFEFNFIG